MSDEPGHGLALNTFSRNVPPGWSAGNPKYPLRLYQQLLRLWWKQTQVSEEQCGPMMAGRLRGTALQLAMSLRATRFCPVRETMHEFVGEELLACASNEAYTTTAGIDVPAQAAGAAILNQALTTEFGISLQDLTAQSLEAFSEFRQGNLSTMDYLTQWRLVFDESCFHSGLQINAVGKTHFLLKASNLSPKQKHDFLLQIGGDRSRFEDLVQIISRFATAESNSRGSGVNDLARIYWQGEEADDGWWDADFDDQWYEGPWFEDAIWSWPDESWSELVPSGEPWSSTEAAGISSSSSSSTPAAPAVQGDYPETLYGKGK